MSGRHVVVVAGGKGLRMGTEIPKQFLPMAGKPVLMWTMEAFWAYDPQMKIVLVLPESFFGYWQSLCSKHAFEVPHVLVAGGETRFHSVKNGLEEVDGGWVAVHDGARPFASVGLIGSCFEAAEVSGAAIPVVPLTDSCRMVEPTGSRIVDRSLLRLVQTPQVFSVDLLKKSYNVDFQESFTDDASVVEHGGHGVALVDGETTNIKITNPIDLEIGEMLVGREKKMERKD